jgi:hypothetical protein
MISRFLQIAREWVSGIELSPSQPKHEKRVGKPGEVFRE